MAESAIEWTDATWNPVGGCSVHSPGCANCYAMKLAGTRLKHHPLYRGTTTPSKAGPVFNGTMTAAPDDHEVWTWPLRWRGAKRPRLGAGKPSLIFVDDMADLFHEDRPREIIDRAVAAVVYSRHIGQFLTKRAEVMRDYFIELRDSGRWLQWPHPILGTPNFDPAVATFEGVFRRVWAGVSIEDRARMPRLTALRDTPAAVRFLSLEPLLEDLGALDLTGIHQVIAGLESGPDARPRHPAIVRSVRDQCAAAGVPFLFKQWGAWLPIDQWSPGPPFLPEIAILPDGNSVPHDVAPQDVGGHRLRFVGKKGAGRRLDGIEHNAFPTPLDG